MNLLNMSPGGYFPFVSNDFSERVQEYLELLKQWNKRINLTRLPEKSWWDSIVFESLALMKPVPIKIIKTSDDLWCDMGTGGGIPGMVLAVAMPYKSIALVDSRERKTDFLQYVKMKMNLRNVKVITARLENETEMNINLGGKVSVFVSRALSTPEQLCEYASPFAEPESMLISPRSGTIDEKTVNFQLGNGISWSGRQSALQVPGYGRNILCLVVRKGKQLACTESE